MIPYISKLKAIVLELEIGSFLVRRRRIKVTDEVHEGIRKMESRLNLMNYSTTVVQKIESRGVF